MRRQVIVFGVWERVRGRFSFDERRMLNRAIVAEIVCPTGVTVDLDQVSPELESKLTAALAAPPRRA